MCWPVNDDAESSTRVLYPAIKHFILTSKRGSDYVVEVVRVKQALGQ
jgi:hypothetical protein